MAEEANDDVGDNAMSNPKSSVIDMLQPFTSQQRPSMFSRIGKDKRPKSYVFRRQKAYKQSKSPTFSIIKTVESYQVHHPQKKGT